MSTSLTATFARNLRRFREQRNLLQRDLAEKFHCPQSYVSDLECGKTSPTLTTIYRLAKILDVPPYKFLMRPKK